MHRLAQHTARFWNYRGFCLCCCCSTRGVMRKSKQKRMRERGNAGYPIGGGLLLSLCSISSLDFWAPTRLKSPKATLFCGIKWRLSFGSRVASPRLTMRVPVPLWILFTQAPSYFLLTLFTRPTTESFMIANPRGFCSHESFLAFFPK